jgi:hypothetical protein
MWSAHWDWITLPFACFGYPERGRMGYQASDDNGETVGIEFKLVEADIYFAKLAHFPLDLNLDLFEHYQNLSQLVLKNCRSEYQLGLALPA